MYYACSNIILIPCICNTKTKRPPPPPPPLSPSSMASHNISLAVLSLLILVAKHGARAADYTVGDNDGWTEGNNYLSWSQKYNFSVGDVLVFKYVEGQHNAYQVSEDVFRSCDSSSGVVAKYSSGHDRVSLTEAAKYWFICDTKGHCQGGMRFGITVLPGAQKPTVPPLPSGDGGVLPQPVPQATNAAGDGGETGRRARWMWGVVGVYCLLSWLN